MNMDCPNCYEQAIVIIGTAYDDGEQVGTVYECLNCDFAFTIDKNEEIEQFGDEPGQSIKL